MLASWFWLGSLGDLFVKQRRTVFCYAKLSNKYLGKVFPKGSTITEILVSIQDQAAELLPNVAAPCFLGVYHEETELTTMEFMCARHNGLRDVSNEKSKLLFEACKVQVMWCVDRCAVLRKESFEALNTFYTRVSICRDEVQVSYGVSRHCYALTQQALMFCSKPDYKADAPKLHIEARLYTPSYLVSEADFEAFPNLTSIKYRLMCWQSCRS